MKKIINNLYGYLGLAYAVLLLVGAVGWALNLITLVQTADAGVTSMFILRIAGLVIVPLGSILGYI